MASGDVVKVTFLKLSQLQDTAKDRTDVPPFPFTGCCFSIPALAEIGGTDYNKNDQHTIIKRYDTNLYSTVTIFIQKYNKFTGEYEDIVELINDAYGTNYPFGTLTDSEFRLKYIAYNIQWNKVLENHGEGTYRFRFKEIDIFATETESFYLFEFCLKTYLPYRADFTTRFDWYTKGYRGDIFSDRSIDIWDYKLAADFVGGDGWFNQLRFPSSFFGSNKSSYEREYVKYSNGQQVWIKDEQFESFVWNSGQYPSLLHDYIKTEIIQADRITVTDYNKNNPNIIVDKAIKPDGNYEPDWKYNNLNAIVDMNFVGEFQNRRKRRC